MAAARIENGPTPPITSLKPTCMVSVNRVAKLPVVESTIQTATNVYGKVKDFNTVTNWALGTAETVVSKAIEVGTPVVAPVLESFEKPIRTVDGYLCNGLDYVEDKVPAVKLPPKEIICTTKSFVNTNITPKLETAYALVQPSVQAAYEKVEPTVEKAKTAIDPVVQQAKVIADPYVQPVIEKAQAFKDYVTEEFHCEHDNHNHSQDETNADKEGDEKHGEKRGDNH